MSLQIWNSQVISPLLQKHSSGLGQLFQTQWEKILNSCTHRKVKEIEQRGLMRPP